MQLDDKTMARPVDRDDIEFEERKCSTYRC